MNLIKNNKNPASIAKRSFAGWPASIAKRSFAGWQKGQSMAELLIAISVYIIIASAVIFLILGSHKSSLQSQEISQAIAINQEGIEAVKSIGNKRWADLFCFQDKNPDPEAEGGKISIKGLEDSAGFWDFDSGESSDLFDKYTRTVSIYPLYRGINGNIVEDKPADCENEGDCFDFHLRRVVATTTWPKLFGSGQHEVAYTTYLSNWQSKDFVNDEASDFQSGIDWCSDPENFAFCQAEGVENTEINTDGNLQLEEIGGGYYKTEGVYISQPFDTGSEEPVYNFIFWDYEWK